MSLNYFCDVIIQTEDVREIKQKLEEVDLSLLDTRDEHGNSLLHLLIQAECEVDVFEIILKRSNVSFRNDEFKLAQDLFVGKKFEKQYENVLVEYLVDKLRNCEGDYIRRLIVQGWNHNPYLQNAIDKLMDQLNDNFTSYLALIESLGDNIRNCIQYIVEGNCNSHHAFTNLLQSSSFNMNEIISFRNQCGLTLIHVAVVFEKYDFVNLIMEICLENKIKVTDYMGRTALHYLHSIKPTPRREDLIVQMSTNCYFDGVDVLGNCAEYYECYPHLLNFDYYREFIKSDLMNIKLKTPDVSVQEETKQSENESEYLKKTVGKALVVAFTLVVERRPNDPVDFLGNFLKFYATNFDASEYDYELLSSKIKIDSLTNSEMFPVEKVFSFNPDIFSPFAKVARDKYGTPYGYKLLIKKLQSIDSASVDWFEIVKRGVNFTLRDSNENTLLEIALSMNFNNIKEHLDSIILNMINEGNLRALQNIYTCGYYENFPDIYDLCGPDLFDVSQEVADFYLGLPREHENNMKLFSKNESDKLNWSELIKNEMNAFAYNRKGMSVIHWAISSNNDSLFYYLVDYFPDCLKLKDCFNRNVCHYCVAFQNKKFRTVIDKFYPEGREELDCFDYLPEYYEFYQSAFRNLI